MTTVGVFAKLGGLIKSALSGGGEKDQGASGASAAQDSAARPAAPAAAQAAGGELQRLAAGGQAPQADGLAGEVDVKGEEARARAVAALTGKLQVVGADFKDPKGNQVSQEEFDRAVRMYADL